MVVFDTTNVESLKKFVSYIIRLSKLQECQVITKESKTISKVIRHKTDICYDDQQIKTFL